MPAFAWSFVRRIVELVPEQRLRGRLLFNEMHLADLNLNGGRGFVPEGLLVESCAQAAGLSLLFGREETVFLPVLVRVNECLFDTRVSVDVEMEVHVECIYRSENVVEFNGAIENLGNGLSVVRCRLMLGLTPLSELPDKGEGILKHLGDLRRHIEYT
jgi:3-hydroxymyristoyl/3-hydroxydecanoyl-(acyl carrier protein) dehydratase